MDSFDLECEALVQGFVIWRWRLTMAWMGVGGSRCMCRNMDGFCANLVCQDTHTCMFRWLLDRSKAAQLLRCVRIAKWLSATDHARRRTFSDNRDVCSSGLLTRYSVVLAITKDNVDTLTLFKRHNMSASFDGCIIWQVAQAASVATTSFESIKVNETRWNLLTQVAGIIAHVMFWIWRDESPQHGHRAWGCCHHR